MAKNPYRPIESAPKPYISVRLKGFSPKNPNESAVGYWDPFEGIWVENMEGPDGNALSAYPDEKPQFGPTHWKVCSDTKRTFSDLLTRDL